MTIKLKALCFLLALTPMTQAEEGQEFRKFMGIHSGCNGPRAAPGEGMTDASCRFLYEESQNARIESLQRSVEDGSLSYNVINSMRRDSDARRVEAADRDRYLRFGALFLVLLGGGALWVWVTRRRSLQTKF